MKQYLDLLQLILDKGKDKSDRTGTGTLAIFGHQMRFNLAEGLPLVTTKKLHTKAIIHELLWFLSGSTNNNYLRKHGVTIWDEWAQPNGELGPIYGKQWRQWQVGARGHYVDQIQYVTDLLHTNPDSRRMLVTAWNPTDIPAQSLTACHCMFQLQVVDNHLSCLVYIRSSDVFLGLPFNIASYAMLTHMFAQDANMQVGDLIVTLGDAHLYKNHLDQARLQLTRTPRPLPVLGLNRDVTSIYDFRYEHFTIHFYQPHPAIKADVAV